MISAKQLNKLITKKDKTYNKEFRKTYLKLYLKELQVEKKMRATAQAGQTFTTFCLSNELVQSYGRDIIKETKLLKAYFESYGYRVQTSFPLKHDDLTCSLRIYIKFTISWGNKI